MIKRFVQSMLEDDFKSTAAKYGRRPYHDQVNRFISNLNQQKVQFKIALSKLLPDHNIKHEEIALLERAYITEGLPPMRTYSGTELAEFGISKKLPKNVEDVNSLVSKNPTLKGKLMLAIEFVNRHKKATAGLVTLSTVVAYLFDTANKMSGCYRAQILPSGRQHLICKVKQNDASNKSFNGVTCDDGGINTACLKTCCSTDPQECSRSGSEYQYTCIKFQWYDVLEHLVRELNANRFIKYVKYFIIFIAALLTFGYSNNLNLTMRLILTAGVATSSYCLVM